MIAENNSKSGRIMLALKICQIPMLWYDLNFVKI